MYILEYKDKEGKPYDQTQKFVKFKDALEKKGGYEVLLLIIKI